MCLCVCVCVCMCMLACVCVFHLLVWIRVVVESYSTVICDFRQILIIKLLQTDVMGRPGRTGGRTLIFTHSTHTPTHTPFVISPPVLMYLPTTLQEVSISLSDAHTECSDPGDDCSEIWPITI